MTKEEIIKTAEDMIDMQLTETGLSREEVKEPSVFIFVHWYINGELTKKDLKALSEYLDYPLDMERADELKTSHVERAGYRLKRKSGTQFDILETSDFVAHIDNENKSVVALVKDTIARNISLDRLNKLNNGIDETYKLVLTDESYKFEKAHVALENGLDSVIAEFTIEYVAHLALLYLLPEKQSTTLIHAENRKLIVNKRTKELEITFDAYDGEKLICHYVFGFFDDVYLKLVDKLSGKIDYLDYHGYGVNVELDKIINELDKERGIAK